MPEEGKHTGGEYQRKGNALEENTRGRGTPEEAGALEERKCLKRQQLFDGDQTALVPAACFSVSY